MNNALIATIFVAIMVGAGLMTGFVFSWPQDSLVYKKATGKSGLDDDKIIEVRGRR